ncbi:MAG: InlB B-repeat-containing protein [Bacilli bacterium]|nr:InlB B-repeat-containing protein [Bacilli bacterium]
MKKIVSFNSLLILLFFVMAIVSSFACINTNAENKVFKITDVTLDEKSDDVTGGISGFDGDQINNNITFHKVNGYVVYKITIKNTATKDIDIKSITDNNSNEYITYEYDKHENYNVKSGKTFDLYVKAIYKKEITDINKRIQKTKVNFSINYLDEDNNVINDVIGINPKTGDYIPGSFIMLIISLIGLATCIGISTKEKNKKVSKAGIIILTLMLTIPVLVKAASIKIDISLESGYSLYDKMVITTIVDGKEKQIVVPYSEETPALEDPTPKAGYEFDKWVLIDGSDYVPTETVTKDVVVVAKFKTIDYSITYNLDGGSADNPTTYTVEDKITLNNPTKQGFDFIGWTGSGVTTPQKNLVINKGTTGPLTYTANFTPSTNTPYKVKHRYLKLTDGYDEVKEDKTGTTNDYVTPELKPKAGFISPSTQNVQIKPDGSTEVIYTYERQPYTFAITDRTYIDSSSTANGTYPYETTITIKAVEREGYTFKWSDNVESYERTFNISQNTTLTPVYTPRTDTPYKVIHKKQKLSLDGYDIAETENKTGTTGEPVTPAVKSYTGFTSPTTQTTTIKGDGTTEIVYEYNREKYDFSFNNNEFVISSKEAGKYAYGTEITLAAKSREGYTFTKWNNNETNNPYTFTLSSNLTIEPVYTANTYQVEYKNNNADATGEMSNQELTYDQSKKLSANSFELVGYEFNGWNTKADGTGTPYADEATVTNLAKSGIVTLYAQWIPSTNTAYKVIHKKQKLSLDGYDIEETENKTGTTGEPVTPAVKEYTGFISPSTQTKNIKADGSLEIVYEYNREKYDFSFNDNEFVTSTKPAGKYPYGTEITLTAQTREGYTFTKWNNNETNNPYTFELSGDLTIEPVYTPRTDTAYKVIHQKQKLTLDGYETVETENKTGTTGEPVTPAVKEYTGFETPATQTKNIKADGSLEIVYKYDRKVYKVEFDTDGGSSVDDQTIVYEGKVIKPNDPTKDNYDFKGWYKDSGYNTEFNFNTETITSTTTIYAKWEEKEDQPYICRRAEELHTSICDRNDNQGCNKTGFKQGDRIIFGNTTEGNNIKGGDAFDCDVNGDGEFNSDTERFYYLRTIDDNAALISHTNFEGTNGQAIVTNFVHDNAYAQLPTITQWSNTNKFGEKAARFPSMDDLKVACNKEDVTADNALKDCYFISENTTYVSTTLGRSGTWLADENDEYYRYQNVAIKIMNVDGTSKNAVRPVIEIPLTKIDLSNEIPNKKITFDTQGGASIDQVEKQYGTKIGTLPTPERDSYDFKGWYKDSEYTTEVKETETIIEDITVYAKWEDAADAVAYMNGKNYKSVQAAINDAPDNTKTTVKLLKDTSETVTVETNRNIEFDLQNYTLSATTANVIKVKGTAKMTNGTVTTNVNQGAIDVESTGTFIMTGGQITTANTSTKQAIYNNGGRVEISGNAILSSLSNQRAAVHNLNSGTMIITSATITAPNYSAIKNETGTLIIGEKDGSSDVTTPTIQGKTYGVETAVMFSYFDGTIKGKTAAINDESKIFDTEPESELVHETIDSYKTVYIRILANRYKITFDPNGGEVDDNNKFIEEGSEIGELPTPTRGVYTFDGWYTEADGGEKISASTIPAGATTYYAHWSFEASDEIVEFNPTNDVMKVYYNKIATWKNDESTFQSNMSENFNNYNCKCNENTCNTSGTELCDKPTAFDTGVNDEVEVYLSNEDKEKGAEVDYTRSTDGTITNMIPGKVYYWEAKDDSNIHGYVKAIANRRIIDVDGVRNIRDLGGMTVSNSSGTGTLKYGKLFRGEKLWNDSENVTKLKKFGIDEEVDLRKASERASGETSFPAEEFKQLETVHYQLDYINQTSNYNKTRNTIKTIMEDIVDGKKIYYHCRIGTDRTGTVSYILEGLLGVEEEQRLQDYELSFFFGLVNRHRFYSYDAASSVSKDQKFVYMRNIMSTNQEIYEWYMLGSTNQQEDNDLIDAFRTKMINYN